MFLNLFIYIISHKHIECANSKHTLLIYMKVHYLDMNKTLKEFKRCHNQ
jgi:hypothetical protein